MVVYKQCLVCGRTPSLEWGGTPEHICYVIGLRNTGHTVNLPFEEWCYYMQNIRKMAWASLWTASFFVLITTSWTTSHVGLKTGIRDTGPSKGDIWGCSNCSRAAKQNPVRAWVLPVHSTMTETAPCSEWKRLCLLFLPWLFHSSQIRTLFLMIFVIEKWQKYNLLWRYEE